MDAVAPQSYDEPWTRYATAAAVTSAVGASWVLVRNVVPVDVACPFLSVTGVPCPFCGMTRLCDRLLGGEVVEAVTRDPGGVLVLVVLGVLVLVAVVTRLGWRPTRWPPVSLAAGALFAAIGIHWATTILGGGFVTG